MTKYKHTQIGYLLLAVMALLTAYFGVFYFTIAKLGGIEMQMAWVMVLILFLLASFTTLTVTINEAYVRIKFGFGIFCKKFLLADISSSSIVKNHWYYGWGVRVWFWPYMWVYNISGFDAVEIVMRDGKVYRIGTDEPEKLNQYIQQGIALRQQKDQ